MITILQMVVFICLMTPTFSEITCIFKYNGQYVVSREKMVQWLEGDKLNFYCYNWKHKTPLCEIHADIYRHSDTNIYTAVLKRQHAGNYTVSCVHERGTFLLQVLYPPEKVEITGPYEVEEGSSFNLTCNADANPAATYWWTNFPSLNAPVISTGATLSVTSLAKGDFFYCFAQNKMVPSFGPAVTKPPVYRERQITYKQVPASIRELPEEYLVHSGLTIDIYCDVNGLPRPSVWWTKRSDDAFNNAGNRLIEQNARTGFAGIYICNARNVLRENGSERIYHARREVHVKIIEPKQIFAITASVAGCVIAVAAITVALVMYIHRKKKHANCRQTVEPSVRLSTIMRNESENVEQQPDSSSYTRMPPTENHWNSACQLCERHHTQLSASEETKKKYVERSDSDTDRLYDIL